MLSAALHGVSPGGESRAGSLAGDRRSNVQITEDMSRHDRQGWCELQRFMLRVMDR